MALAETWWQIGPALAQRGWRVTAIDLPGTRATSTATAPSTSMRWSTASRQRLAAPVDLLVGHSLGAIVALGLLARDPGVARAVVLEEPPGPSRHRPGRAGRRHRARRRGGAPRPRPAGGPRARGQPALGPGRRRAVRARHRGGRQRRDRRRPRRPAALGPRRTARGRARSRRSSSPPPMRPAASRWTPARRCAAQTATRCARRSRPSTSCSSTAAIACTAMTRRDGSRSSRASRARRWARRRRA